MKKILLLSFSLLLSVSPTFSQLGRADNITVTDINGIQHHLYSILDEGKVVIFEVFSTRCIPCWTLHEAGYLNELHEAYGPDGTDQIRVIAYEGLSDSFASELYGNTPNSIGNWVTGIPYPIVNQNPVLISLDTFAPYGFPTVNVIRPSDKEIVSDLFDQNLQGMIDTINQIITLGETTSDKVVLADEISMNIFPNPTADVLYLDLSNIEGNNIIVEIRNILGQSIQRHTTVGGQNAFPIKVVDLPSGDYFLKVQSETNSLSQKFIKL